MEDIPETQWKFVERYCIDCHDEDMNEGGVNLDFKKVNWLDSKVRDHWAKAHSMVKRGKMPPKRKKKQPATAEKKSFLSWLDRKLLQVESVGGTPIRRLNKREYLATVQDVFGLKDFELPGSFPQDLSNHGFDTLAKDLVVSPSHFEAYKETAVSVADYLFPPVKSKLKPKKWNIEAKDLTISYSSAYLIDGAMRLASSGQKTRNGTWPSKFEAPVSGTYKVKLVLSTKNPQGLKPEVLMKSHFAGRKSKERSLSTFNIQKGAPQEFSETVDLYKGENLLFLFSNAPFNYGVKDNLQRFMEKLFTKDPRLAAAWAEQGKIVRGGIGWARIKETLKRDDLNIAKYRNKNEVQKLAKDAAGKNPVVTGETLVYKFFEEGPNIGIHSIEIFGPIQEITDPEVLKQQRSRQQFLGNIDLQNETHIQQFMQKYLASVFRRKATSSEIANYTRIIMDEFNETKRIEDGYHLAIRTSLISPDFLYREIGQGKLSQYELASRLSYFLTSSVPDEKLIAAAENERLFNSEIIRSHSSRLIKSFKSTKFIQDFTSQWLDTAVLDFIMPDNKVFRKFNFTHANMMKDEVETHFRAILNKNMSLNEFIDPDFIFTNNVIGKEIYKLNKVPKTQKKLTRVSIPRGSTRGGLLSMPAVMMATANGVDTEPVLRGVWILENILGSHLPPPPQNVPALPPDTSGATDPRDKLAKHMGNASCASCHEDIDPMGFVLESFDPVGRWRTHYPTSNKKAKSLKINTSATMADGTKLKDVRDLKKYLINNPEHFANCLAEKLLEYATGRKLNYKEKMLKKDIVSKNIRNGNKFHDLILALIDSPIFKSR